MSTLKVQSVQHPSAASAAIALDANGQATLNGLTFPTSGSLSGRNRIINGDMRIDQRNAGANVAIANNTPTYTADRWLVYSNNDGACSMQRVSEAPAGFTNSLKFTTTTADASLSATQRATLQHRIEGFNASDLGWGTASAQPVTISFWVRSSLTGSFGGAVQNESVNRAYPFAYTISAANTWEQKTVTITGETTGTWSSDNTSWGRIVFGLGVGSTYSGTAGAWVAGDLNSTTSAVSVIGTLNATWQITGVQLEAGSVATPFERRSYGQELALCQRYFCKPLGGGASGYGRSHGYDLATSRGPLYLPLPVQMRSSPSVSISSQYVINDGGSPFGYGAYVVAGGSADTAYMYVAFTSQPPAGSFVSFGANCAASAEL